MSIPGRIDKEKVIPKEQERYLSVKQVAEILGIGVSTVWFWCSPKGIGFPSPVKIPGARSTRWKLSAINEFMANQK